MDARIIKHIVEITLSEDELLKLSELADKYSMGEVEWYITTMLKETPDSIIRKFYPHHGGLTNERTDETTSARKAPEREPGARANAK